MADHKKVTLSPDEENEEKTETESNKSFSADSSEKILITQDESYSKF